MAFGTGTHPTTRMCLRWIAGEGRRRPAPGSRVLDYGCGSGVLAIAAGLFGATTIDRRRHRSRRGGDDASPTPPANSVPLRAGTADSLGGNETFDLILANILATPLKLLAPLLCEPARAGGRRCVLSGILATQAAELQAAYAPWLAIEVADRDDGWILMTGRRGPRGMISR